MAGLKVSKYCWEIRFACPICHEGVVRNVVTDINWLDSKEVVFKHTEKSTCHGELKTENIKAIQMFWIIDPDEKYEERDD